MPSLENYTDPAVQGINNKLKELKEVLKKNVAYQEFAIEN